MLLGERACLQVRACVLGFAALLLARSLRRASRPTTHVCVFEVR